MKTNQALTSPRPLPAADSTIPTQLRRPGRPSFPRWRARLLGGAAALLLLAGAAPRAQAGLLATNHFEASDFIPGNVFGSALQDTIGGNTNLDGDVTNTGCLKLDTANGQTGGMVLFDLDNGSAINAFDLEFDLRMGSDNFLPLHGDGFSISFGPDVPQATFTRAFEGGGSGLKVSFATTTHNPGTNTALTIRVSYNNTLIGFFPFTAMNTGTNYQHVSLVTRTNGSMALKFGATTVFNNLFGFVPTQGQFLFAAVSQGQVAIGDPVDLMWMDNLFITSSVPVIPTLISVAPQGIENEQKAKIQLQLQDGATTVDTNKIVLQAFGSNLLSSAYTITQQASTNANPGVITTILFSPTNNWGSGSSNRFALVYTDSANVTNSVTNAFFAAVNTTLPASYAVNAAEVNQVDGNTYTVYPYRTVPSVAMNMGVAQSLQAGLLVNNADLSFAGADGGVSMLTMTANFGVTGIDFSSGGNVNPRGFLTNDFAFPFNGAATGNNGTTAAADEWITYLKLAPGTYTMGVDVVSNYNGGTGIPTEGGVQVSVGPTPRDMFAPVVALFDNAWPEGTKQFSITVTNAGIYPFRMFNFSGPGGTGLEWYLMTNGTRMELSQGLIAQGNNAYGTPAVTHPYVQYQPLPVPGDQFVPVTSPALVTLVDGTATTVTNTITLSLNGTPVGPLGITNATVQYPNTTGGYLLFNVVQIGYHPASLPGGSSNYYTLAYTDTSGSNYTRSWGFNTLSGVNNDPHLLVAEAEEYNSLSVAPTNDFVTTNAINYGFTAPDPNTGLLVPAWVFGSDTVTNITNPDGSGTFGYTNGLRPTNFTGFSGTGVMLAVPNANFNSGTPATVTNIVNMHAPYMNYILNFQDPGIYYVWARGWGDAGAANGSGNGSGGSKSVHFGLDGVLPTTGANMGGAPPSGGLVFTFGSWKWGATVQNSATRITLNITNAGPHTVSVIMREDGFVIDKFLLTTNVAYTPSGLGPAKNLGVAAPIVITYAPVAGGIQLTWTGGTTLQSATSIAGPWNPAPEGSVSPVTILIPNGQPTRFFRVLK